MEGHSEPAGEGPARLGGRGAGRRVAGAAVDGRRMPLPGRFVQDGDQQDEPVVHGVAVPERRDGDRPARERPSRKGRQPLIGPLGGIPYVSSCGEWASAHVGRVPPPPGSGTLKRAGQWGT